MPALGLLHRRLLLLLAILVATSMALGTQLVRLAVVEHEEHRAQTESFLRRRTFLPFVRGSILDRNGELLAGDRASWDVQVEYSVIAGRWAADQARSQARRELGPNEWARLGRDARVEATLARLPAWEARAEGLYEELCLAGGFDRAELERRFDEIRQRIAPRVEAYRERLRRAAAEKAARTGEAPAPVAEDETISEQEEPHTILADVDDATAFRFQALADQVSGTLAVVPATRRQQPWSSVELEVDRSRLPSPLRSQRPLALRLEGVADHILGGTRTRVFTEDLARRPFLDPGSGEVVDLGGYRVDRDQVGATGMERTLEDRLRGLRGIVVRDLESGASERIEPVRGEDVRLTLDIRLQARVQAALDPRLGLARIQQWQRGWTAEGEPKGGPLPPGWELNGAAVVLDIESGDILAMVSTPTLAESSASDGRRRDLADAAVNKPVAGIYPPGSIVKPLLYAGAVAQGAWGRDDAVACNGHFFEEVTTSARCWIWRPEEGRSSTHGLLGVEEAIARSCNIYFYTVASRLGLDGTIEWYRRYGVGRPLDVGLLAQRDGPDGGVRFDGEAGGSLPSERDRAALRRGGDRSAAIFMGIGQGPVAWTPLHAAHAYATLARSGRVVRPSLILDRQDRGRAVDDLGLESISSRRALEGLRQSIEETFGTGHHLTLEDGAREPIIEVEGVRVWGKTGTAQAPPLRLGVGGSAETTIRTDHAWFVGLVGVDRPRYAVAVLVEYGGSGGKTAGPIAAQIIRALVAEGHLATNPVGAGATRR